MKKNRVIARSDGGIFLRKSVLMMKFVFVFVLCCFLQVRATTYAQQARVSVAFKNVPLEKVFQEIGRQANCRFLYNYQMVKTYREVSIQAENKELNLVLDELLTKLGLCFTFDDNLIIIRELSEVAQQKKGMRVQGFVHDAGKSPLPGVTVKIVGLTIGTSTNAEGWFALDLPMKEGELEFSFVGFKKQKVAFTAQTDTLRIVMEEDLQQMEEVVVTGYQQIDKRHMTSAVTTVKMEDIAIPGVNRVDAMLEGQIPGLIFMQNTGQVGAAPKLRIRGTSTILGSQEPVWVVDGIVVQDPVKVDPAQLNDLDFVNLLGNAISGLNPDDIERIDVLKDASATALYGASAANGVIVITTKRGKVGKPTVSYSFSGTFTQRPRYSDRGLNMMNSKERVEVSRDLMESGVRYSGTYDSFDDWIGYERAYIDYFTEGNIDYNEFVRQAQWYETMNTDWLGILTKDVFSNNHSLSISGGSNEFRYYFSLGYADEQGNVIKEENKRYTSTMKLTLNYPKLSAQFGLNGSVNNKRYNPEELNVMSYAYSMSRAIPLRDRSGELWYYKKNDYPFNIVNEMDNSSRDIDQYTAMVTGQVAYKFTEALKLTGTASFNFGYTNEQIWFGEESNKVTAMRKGGTSSSLCPFGGILQKSNATNTEYTLRLQADYSKYFGEGDRHFFNAMLGYELSSKKNNAESSEERGYYADRGKSFATDYVPYVGWGSGYFDDYPLFYQWRMNNYPKYTESLSNTMAAFATLTYGYRDRYIVNFNTRADWANTFGSRSNEKLLPVWSVSARWNATNDVLKDVAWIENLALRFSYGVQGNMVGGQPNRLVINKGNYNADLGGFVSTINSYPNVDLKWEKTHSYNVGLDFSFLQGKINGSVAYFYKKTVDAFLSKMVASQNGVTSYTVNAGNVENQGVELALNFKIIDQAMSANGKRGFVWRMDPQLGQTLNKLINRAISKNNAVLQDEIQLQDLLDGNAYIAGTPMNTFYSWRFDGLDKTGIPTFKGLEDADQEALKEKYRQMAKEDKKDVWLSLLDKSGTRVPVLQGGLNNYFAYRNFSLSVNMTYSIGNKIRLLKLCSGDYSAIRPLPHNNLRKEFTQRWRGAGDEKTTNIPGIRTSTLVSNGNSNDVSRDYGWWKNEVWAPKNGDSKYTMYDYSDLRVARGDYLRLRSLVFKYTFDKELVKKWGMSSAYLSFSAENLFTLCSKDLKGQNPEQSGSSSIVNITIRPTYSVSLNVNF